MAHVDQAVVLRLQSVVGYDLILARSNPAVNCRQADLAISQ